MLLSRTRIDPRLEQIKVAWYLIKRNPLFGHGLHTFRSLRPDAWVEINKNGNEPLEEKGEHVHFEFIEMVVELGILGAGLWLAIVGHCLVRAFGGPLFPIILAMLVVSCFYFPFRRPYTGLLFWTLLGLSFPLSS